MKYQRFAGTTLSYQLYRVGKWLWEKEIRKTFNKIVEYVEQLSGTIEDEGVDVQTAINKIFGRQLDTDTFNYILKRLRDLERIKNVDFAILLQLRSFGNNIQNYKELDGFIFAANPRPWFVKGEMKKAFSFVLAIPSLSRVVSYQTSEDFETYSQFSSVHIENSQFYSMFNKLKALRGRDTQSSSELASVDILSFLFRNIVDLKTIHDSPKIHLFTFTPTTGEEAKKFQVANYFIILGKIQEFKISDMSGKKIVTVEDSSGLMKMMVDDKEIIRANKSTIKNTTDEYFKNNTPNTKQINLSYRGYCLIFGYWGMDEEHPWIFHMIPLGHNIPNKEIEKFNFLAYINTRKKISGTTLEKLFPEISEIPKEITSDGKWSYLVKPDWDREEFLKSAKSEKKEFKNALEGFLGVNAIFTPLYLSETPEKEFAEFYRLSAEKICSKCGRELFEVSSSAIQQHIENNDGNISVEIQSMHSYNINISDTLNLIKSNLGQIISLKNEDKAAVFISEFFKEKKFIFGDMDIISCCKIIHDILISIKEIKQRRIFFQFHNNLDLIPMFLEIEKPRNIHVGDPKMLELSLGKNCVEHGPVEHDASNVVGNISKILIQYAREAFAKNQQKRFFSSSRKIKEACEQWHNIVDITIENNSIIPAEKILNFKNKWTELLNEINDETFSNFEGKKIDLPQIKSLDVDHVIFFIMCYLVSKKEFRFVEDWESLMHKIAESKRLQRSDVTRQTGNISDKNLVLHAIAQRFLNFHYKSALGGKEPFGTDVLYSDLSQRMVRCTSESRNQDSQKFKKLKLIRFDSGEFRELCKKLLCGDIGNMQNAENFLRRYSRKRNIPNDRFKQRGKSVNQSLEAKKMMSNWADSKTVVKKKDNNFKKRVENKNEKYVKTNNVRIPIKKENFGRDLEGLGMEWERARVAKSQTHAPQKYQEIKNSLQPKVQDFMNYYSKTCPAISKLRGKTLEAKEIKKFFNMISQMRDPSQEDVAKMMTEI